VLSLSDKLFADSLKCANSRIRFWEDTLGKYDGTRFTKLYQPLPPQPRTLTAPMISTRNLLNPCPLRPTRASLALNAFRTRSNIVRLLYVMAFAWAAPVYAASDVVIQTPAEQQAGAALSPRVEDYGSPRTARMIRGEFAQVKVGVAPVSLTKISIQGEVEAAGTIDWVIYDAAGILDRRIESLSKDYYAYSAKLDPLEAVFSTSAEYQPSPSGEPSPWVDSPEFAPVTLAAGKTYYVGFRIPPGSLAQVWCSNHWPARGGAQNGLFLTADDTMHEEAADGGHFIRNRSQPVFRLSRAGGDFSTSYAPVVVANGLYGTGRAFHSQTKSRSEASRLEYFATVSDADGFAVTNGSVAITAGYVSGEDVLELIPSADSGNIEAKFDAALGTLSLFSPGAMATMAHWEAALRAVSYKNVSLAPSTAVRTVAFTLNDGTSSGVPATLALSVVPFQSRELVAVENLPVNLMLPSHYPSDVRPDYGFDGDSWLSKVGGAVRFTPDRGFLGAYEDSYLAVYYLPRMIGPTDFIFNNESITVKVVPSFSIASVAGVAQNTGPQRFTGWATPVRLPAHDEAGQILKFNVSADRPELFTVQPSISPDGTLTFVPGKEASGTARVKVTLTRDLGPVYGGSYTSRQEVFLIRVTSPAEETGLYNGIVQGAPGGPAGPAQSGLVRLNVTKSGAFTGSLRLAGVSHTFQGVFDNAGVAHFGRATTLRLARKGQPPLTLKLQLDVGAGTGKLIGTLMNGNQPFALVDADRAGATKAQKALAGRYTVLFTVEEPSRNPALFPQGDGIGTLLVGANGRVQLTGTLPDGTPISAAHVLSRTNRFPLYVPLAGGRGSLSGSVQFQNLPGVSDLHATELRWFKPERKGAMHYPRGWMNGLRTKLIGSRFTLPRASSGRSMLPGLSAAGGLGNAKLELSGGGLGEEGWSRLLDIDNRNQVRVIDREKEGVQVTLRSNGLFTATLQHPVTKTTTTAQGVVFQKQKLGSGFFLGERESGAVSLRASDREP
jgi:hypothetical protein